MTDKMREEFEVAYQAACLSRAVARFDPSVFAKDHCDDYLSSLVQSAWWGWQASRAALVIELPDYTSPYYGGDHFDECQYAADCEKAIEAAGLKVKP